MNIVIETDRLLLRTFTENDAPLIYELNLDPGVTRYIHDPVKTWLIRRNFWKKLLSPNMFFTIMAGGQFLKSQDLDPIAIGFIGWCGLKYRHELNEIDPGYRFKKES